MFDWADQKSKFFNLFYKQTEKKWLTPIVLAAIFVLFVLIIATLAMIFEITYTNRFFPGSHIGKYDLSGLSRDQAFKLLDQVAQKNLADTIRIDYENNGESQQVALVENLSADSARDFFEFDIHATVYKNMEIGRGQGIIKDLIDQAKILLGQENIKAYYSLDRDYLKKILINQFSGLEQPPANAQPQIICDKSRACQISIIKDKNGLTFDYDQAINEWERGLQAMMISPIKLRQSSKQPQITAAQVSGLDYALNDLLAVSSTPEFYYEDKVWKLNQQELSAMIEFQENSGKISFGANKEKFGAWWKSNIASAIDIESQNASVQIIDGKVSALSSQKIGKKADFDRAYLDLNDYLSNSSQANRRITINMIEVQPDVAISDINSLGITSIIGTGMSDFSGSPANRIKNIKNGAAKLQGKLIKPGEDFSLIKALLPIDASNGYFTELVIKGNKTTAEYGGGLCQVGTTFFRAALASGLPILERQNHSYNVAYYLENGKPGVDATIYDPKPDLRFRNDTGNYILVQTRIAGSKLYFDFWGTSDGRVATRTVPRVWGVKDPAAPKLIETTDLPVGQKKCTEKAHKGISASFDYIVNYANGSSTKQTFTSIYKPWQEVCLIGVSQLAAASSTLPAP